MRGQAAIEWMVILGLGLMVLSAMIAMNNDTYSSFKGNFKVSKVKGSLNELKNAVDFVFSQGKDARTRVLITVPASVNITVGTVSSGRGQIAANVFVDGKQEFFDVYTEANITGAIPDKEGSYCMEVECLGEVVNITRSSGSC
jgi:hypothetical protein